MVALLGYKMLSGNRREKLSIFRACLECCTGNQCWRQAVEAKVFHGRSTDKHIKLSLLWKSVVTAYQLTVPFQLR